MLNYTVMNVYRDSNGMDCTNNGASAKYEKLFLFAENTNPAEAAEFVDVNSDRVKAEQCFVVEVLWRGQENEYRRAVPLFPRRDAIHMAGGNWGYSCDERYRTISGLAYPISIHDRYETQEEYDMLSN